MKFSSILPITDNEVFSEIFEFEDYQENELYDLYLPMNPNYELILFRNYNTTFKNGTSKKGIIRAPYTKACETRLNKGYHFVVIRLKPTVFYRIFGDNLKLQKNEMINIDGINVFEDIQDMLFGREEIEETTLQKIENKLKAFMKFKVHKEVLSLLKTLPMDTMVPIFQIFQDLGLDQQRYQKLFSREVGVSPKQYQIIIRENKLEAFFSEYNPHIKLRNFKLKNKKSIIQMEIELLSAYASVAYTRLRDSCIASKMSVENSESFPYFCL